MKFSFKSNFIKGVALAICISCSNDHRTIQNESRPNIVYILADDLGYGDLKSLNPDSKIPTPNLDKIVRSGVHFTDAHSNSAVCTPTRYGILTGRYAFRSALKKGVLGGYSPSLIEKGRQTVASFLKANGYQTACIGKWHLGLDWVPRNNEKEFIDIPWEKGSDPGFDDGIDYEKQVTGGPSDHGFDYSFIIPASLDMGPYCYLRNGKAVELPTDFTDGKSEKQDGRGVFWRSGKMSPGFDFEQVLPTVVDEACQFIGRQSYQGKPYFLYLPLPAPHTPWLPLEEYAGRSGAGKYGDYVTMVDDMIGKVLLAIKTGGMEKNTLIIVTSDNGSDWSPSDIDEWGHRANFIFKGRKADIYEAGHRIPFIASWEGVIPSGTKSNELMCTTDLMATVAGLLKQDLSGEEAEDSFNMWPAFINETNHSPARESIIHHSLDGFFSIRKGKWKFTPHLGSGGFTQPQNITPKEGDAPGTLYDIEKDPQEAVNLYRDYPNVVQELSKLLYQYKEQGYSRQMGGLNEK